MILESVIDINCKNLLDNLPFGVYSTDLERKIIYWNKAAEKISGFRAEEVIGSYCFDNILKHIDKKGRDLCKSLCPLAKTIHYKTSGSVNV